MSKRPSGAVLTGMQLDRNTETPLHRQLYEGLRGAILAGGLPAGGRLPSSRTLAAELGVARATAVEAFEQLLAEGYLEGKVGSGTYVSATLPEELLRPARQPDPGQEPEQPRRGVSARCRQQLAAATDFRQLREASALGPRAFRLGVPALDAFPHDLWGKLIARQARDLQPWKESAWHLAGYPQLREAVAAYLVSARGLRCTPEQVIIVGGAQQGIGLAAQVLADPGDPVWLEDPAFTGLQATLDAAAVRTVPVPVDAGGLDVQAGRRLAPEARLVCVTPSHQFPLGVVMSLRRRLELLDWARAADAWIIEDDYDSEYRYAGRPLKALQGLDRDGRVLYAGTFSKVLLPSLRLGYLVVPTPLIDPFTAALVYASISVSTLEQAVVAAFMAEGHLERHLRRMRALYAARQATLLAAAHSALAGKLDLRPAEAGLHLVAPLPSSTDDTAIARLAAAEGVSVQPLSRYYRGLTRERGLLLGYAAATEAEIRDGVQALSRALR
jgi:GntR family transcriptional regulator/MocR family aminotransferase